MENATKALLIAAGMLLVVMLLSLLMTFWDNVSGYFTVQDRKGEELRGTEQVR